MGRLRSLLVGEPTLADLMADLEAALAKQARFTARVGAANTAQMLAFGYAASEAAWVARQTLLAWTEWVCQIRGHRTPNSWPAIAAYLSDDALAWLARHPDGPQAIDEITAGIRQARATIDRPMDRRFVGTCGALGDDGAACTQVLYARADRDTVACPRCDTEWTVRDRQDELLDRIRDVELTAADVARAVDGLGIDITPELIRQWKRRGLLAQAEDEQGAKRSDRKGRPLYRVGDVLDVVAERTGNR